MLARHFTFTLIWASIILILYGIPGSNLPSVRFWKLLEPDKAVHAGIFLILMCSLTFSIFKQHKFKTLKRNSLRSSALICFMYGTVLELLQGSLFSERFTDVYDILANAIGVFLGIVILKIFFRDILS